MHDSGGVSTYEQVLRAGDEVEAVQRLNTSVIDPPVESTWFDNALESAPLSKFGCRCTHLLDLHRVRRLQRSAGGPELKLLTAEEASDQHIHGCHSGHGSSVKLAATRQEQIHPRHGGELPGQGGRDSPVHR